MVFARTAGKTGLFILALTLALSFALADEKLGDGKMSELLAKMRAKFGSAQAARMERGVHQARALWQARDGSEEDFAAFCLANFIADPVLLDRTFERFQKNFETLNGNFLRISRDFNEPIQLDLGDPLPVDYIFAEWSPSAHIDEDFYRNRLAFVVILNFPHSTLADKLVKGGAWSRKEWARAKLGDRFTARVPPDVNQALNTSAVKADNYISEYNVFMGKLLSSQGRTLFPEDLKLITHWGLRDELKSWYGKPEALPRQETIFAVMNRIIDQSIPARVINRSDVLWEPVANKVFEERDGKRTPVEARPEPDTRYATLLDVFGAQRRKDPHVPLSPSLIARRFQDDRQIPEDQVEALLSSVAGSPQVARVAAVIEKRLGRKLLPFDIWYDGFKARSSVSVDLDAAVRAKYPTVKAFQDDIPVILGKLGFSPEKAAWVAARIVVDPSRGAGHALGAEMRADCAHLRTRVPADGMNYKGYNIAVHELGHNVEQVFSLHGIDEYFLSGVPNTAFTEAFAFVFQARDLELLGIEDKNPRKKHLDNVDALWSAYEIAGPSLVDMKVWNWLYANPKATPSQLKAAVLSIARDVWNKYYAPVFGVRDVSILAVYSHMIDAMLYLPDYPLGHIIAFQIESYLEGKNLGAEMERMCKIGSVTPRLWMETAVGSDVSTRPMLEAAAASLDVLEKETSK